MTDVNDDTTGGRARLRASAALGFQRYVEELHAGLAEAGFEDLRPNFGLVFRALDEEPQTLTRLATRLGVSKQAAAKIVAELQGRRFVEQRAGEDDRRTRLLVLSTRGRDLVRAAKRISRKVERRLRRASGSAAVDGMRRVLVAMVEADEGQGGRVAGTAGVVRGRGRCAAGLSGAARGGRWSACASPQGSPCSLLRSAAAPAAGGRAGRRPDRRGRRRRTRAVAADLSGWQR